MAFCKLSLMIFMYSMRELVDYNLANIIVKAEVKTKKSKVLSFKLYMPNEDTLSIIKLHLQ